MLPGTPLHNDLPLSTMQSHPAPLTRLSGRVLSAGPAWVVLARWIGAIALVLALTGLVGPAWAQAQDAAAEAKPQIDRVIEVKMASFRYFPDTLRIPTQETVELVFHNEGNFAHEFMVGRTLADDSIGYQTHLFEGVEVQKSKATTEQERAGVSLTVEPDSSQSLTFHLPPSKQGEWEMGCFLTNPALHYRAGMKGTVRVR